MDGATPVEFARPIEVSRLTRDEQRFDIAANPAERVALAKRFELPALDRLNAVVHIGRIPGGLIRLRAEIFAEVTQSCVVTLEPVMSRVDESFALLYGDDEEAREVVLEGEGEPVEPIAAGIIDIGEAVAQQLSLALDPFPHAPGAVAPHAAAGAATLHPDSPFAVLARLRNKNDSKD